MQARAEALTTSYLEQGVTFDIGGEERAFPLDIMPRVIEQDAWSVIDQGVQQRVKVLEMFLDDVYDTGQVFEDGVIPRSVVTTSSHFHRVAAGVKSPNGVRIHVAGIDLIRDADGSFRVLEDNVRVPSGVSYVMTNRRAISAALSEAFTGHRIRPVGSYPRRLLNALRASAPAGVDDPTVVVLTPGVYNGAYFEHALLARTMGIELVEGRDLVCQRGRVMMRTTSGLAQVHVIYRRVDDEFLDPVHFRSDSMLGCPGLMNAARAGNVTIANAVGNGVADDKLVYTYLPDLIRYYLGEEPVLANVDTWRLGEAAHREEVLDRLDELVLKPVDGSGGKGIVIGPARPPPSSRCCAARCSRTRVRGSPSPSSSCRRCRRSSRSGMRPRHVDLRPFAVNDGHKVWVLPGGLTRVALPEGELIVNSSRGGGSKDTWVLAGGRAVAPAPAAPAPEVHAPPLDTGPAIESRLDAGRAASSRRGGVVLSRIAESLFWIGRYVERAEDTARILDVQTQMMVEDPSVDIDSACRTLLGVMGTEIPEGRLTLEVVAVPAGLRHRRGHVDHRRRIGGARESARRARETLSTDLWEVINSTYRTIASGRFRAMRTPGRVPLGARAGGRHQRHRRRDDEPRRGLAVPDPRPVPRARRHDRPAGRHLGAEPRDRTPRGRPRCAPAAPTSRSCAPTAASRPTARRRSTSCSTGSSRARWCTR